MSGNGQNLVKLAMLDPYKEIEDFEVAQTVEVKTKGNDVTSVENIVDKIIAVEKIKKENYIVHPHEAECQLWLNNSNFRASPEKFLCEVCGYTLGSKIALKRHMKRLHPDGKSLNKFSRRRIDVIIPDNEKSKIIDQVFTNTLSKSGIRLSNNLKQFIASTSDVDKLSILHLSDGKCDTRDIKIVVKNEDDDTKKSLICGICGKLFANKYVLSTHRIIHTGIRPFNCQYCFKAFKTKGQMQTHEQKHFNVETQMYEEQVCKTRKKTEICDLCGESFVNKYVLATHRKFHYGLKSFNCMFCTKAFKTKGQLKAHDKRRHNSAFFKHSEP